jgi:hypothetical protein
MAFPGGPRQVFLSITCLWHEGLVSSDGNMGGGREGDGGGGVNILACLFTENSSSIVCSAGNE